VSRPRPPSTSTTSTACWYCLARRTLIESQMAYTNNGKESKPAHDALRWSVQAKK
jgi:hypothetical protein